MVRIVKMVCIICDRFFWQFNTGGNILEIFFFFSEIKMDILLCSNNLDFAFIDYEQLSIAT